MVEEIIAGEKVYFYDEVSSTMDVAKKLLKEGEKGIVVAKKQTKGRGRYGKYWLSDEGGLYFSMIIEKSVISDFLSEIISISLVETIKTFGIICKIKFPNDIIYKGKKISGILIERSDDNYIVGIGVNLNNKISKFGVSMKEILKKEININEFLEKFLTIYKTNEIKFCEKKENCLKEWSEFLLK